MLSQSEELQAQTLVGNVLNTVDLFHNVRGYGNDGVADESKKKKKKKKKDSKKRQRESDDEEDTPVQEVIVKRTTSIEEWSAVLHALPVIR